MTRISTAALAFGPFLLAACGGGSDGTAPLPSASPTTSISTPAVLTLAEYQALRLPAIAPSVKDVELARPLAIRLTVPNEITGSGTVFSAALNVARLQVLNAAASGDTAKELAAISPEGSLGATGAVLTLPLRRRLMIQPGVALAANFWAATEQQAARKSVDSWLASDINLEGAAGIPSELFSTSYERRLAIEDRLAVDVKWPAATTTSALFTDESGQRYVVDALRITGLRTTLTTDTYRAEALAVDGWTVLKLTPSAGSLTDFGPDRLAAAIKASTDALLGSVTKSTASDLLLPPQSIGSSSAYSGIGLSGAPSVFSADNANLVAMDNIGGQFAKALSTAMQLDVDRAGLRLDGKAWLGFAFNPKNVHANTGSAGGVVITQVLPSPGIPVVCTVDGCGPQTPCPSDAPSLRSFFLAVLDARGVLQALTWVQTVAKAGDCR